jgi:hypothetical protein
MCAINRGGYVAKYGTLAILNSLVSYFRISVWCQQKVTSINYKLNLTKTLGIEKSD